MRYLLDTHAWIEFFKGSPRARKAKAILQHHKGNILVSDAVFAELYDWAVRAKKDHGKVPPFVRQHAEVFGIYTNIWVEATDLKLRMRRRHSDFGQIDALLLAIQRHTSTTVVTGDPHFKGLKNVVMI